MGGNEEEERQEGREKGGNGRKEEGREERITQHSKRAEIKEFQSMTRTCWGLQQEFSRPCFSQA